MTISRTTIGTLSKATGVNIETIRYYERIGLVPKPLRSEGGQRIYTPMDEKRLTFIKRCRELGFPLDDIRALMALSETEDRACQEVLDVTESHLSAVRRKITDLMRMEATLENLAQSCEGGTSRNCPILDVLSA